MVSAISGAKAGDRTDFIREYQGGLSKVISNLTADEKVAYQTIADEWNREGLPEDLQRK
jgi:hypothetical protein